jgi:hypothetical protein
MAMSYHVYTVNDAGEERLLGSFWSRRKAELFRDAQPLEENAQLGRVILDYVLPPEGEADD